jgi:glutathione peroxidase
MLHQLNQSLRAGLANGKLLARHPAEWQVGRTGSEQMVSPASIRQGNTIRMDLRLLILALTVLGLSGCVQENSDMETGKADTSVSNPLEVPVQDIEGNSLRLADFDARACLVVNVASECGFTPQYEGLEALYSRYGDRGLVVVGFPCNQFGQQEPGTNAEIKEFCTTSYGVTFPMMSKVEVNGDGAHPLYAYLVRNSEHPGKIQWNFTKFLLDREGHVVARFEPQVEPHAAVVTDAIEELLQ